MKALEKYREVFFISWTPVKNLFSWTPVKYFKIGLGNCAIVKIDTMRKSNKHWGSSKKCFSWMAVNEVCLAGCQ